MFGTTSLHVAVSHQKISDGMQAESPNSGLI